MEAPPSPPPIVGVIMGSDSDLPCMIDACNMLEQFGVPYETTIVSAHRTPQRMVTYAGEAAGRGLRVIIAGAGGAAHLPGMVAALTPLPVIGVPVKTSALSGVDSLYSIVQMPGGVPVATVAIGNAKNAGLLAIRMLAGCGQDAEAARLTQLLVDFRDTACPIIDAADTRAAIRLTAVPRRLFCSTGLYLHARAFGSLCELRPSNHAYSKASSQRLRARLSPPPLLKTPCSRPLAATQARSVQEARGEKLLALGAKAYLAEKGGEQSKTVM